MVKIVPNAVPPVCKIMDYGKYRFEQSKREKEQRKNQTVIETKEIRLSATIDTHDMEVKAKACQQFLKGGNKVKVSIQGQAGCPFRCRRRCNECILRHGQRLCSHGSPGEAGGPYDADDAQPQARREINLTKGKHH